MQAIQPPNPVRNKPRPTCSSELVPIASLPTTLFLAHSHSPTPFKIHAPQTITIFPSSNSCTLHHKHNLFPHILHPHNLSKHPTPSRWALLPGTFPNNTPLLLLIITSQPYTQPSTTSNVPTPSQAQHSTSPVSNNTFPNYPPKTNQPSIHPLRIGCIPNQKLLIRAPSSTVSPPSRTGCNTHVPSPIHKPTANNSPTRCFIYLSPTQTHHPPKRLHIMKRPACPSPLTPIASLHIFTHMGIHLIRAKNTSDISTFHSGNLSTLHHTHNLLSHPSTALITNFQHSTHSNCVLL